MRARSPKEAAEVTSKQTESKRFLSPTQKEQAAKFTSFMVGGGIAGKVVGRLAQIPALVRWFNNLKSKPTIEKAADKVEQLTGTRPKITPKPTKMKTDLVPKGQAKAPATVKKLPSVKRVDTKTAPKPKTRPKVRDRDKSTGRAIRTALQAGMTLAATIEDTERKAKEPTSKAEAKTVTGRGRSTERGVSEQIKTKIKKAKKKIDKALEAQERARGKPPPSWKEGLDPITVAVEEALGLKRRKSKIRRDMRITDEIEKALAFSGGKQRGGMVKRSSSRNTKKYAMNRGGMASVRKPTRA